MRSCGSDQTTTMAVVVVNYGCHRLIEANLSRIPVRNQDVRVVVVDNFSTERERQDVQDLAADRGWDFIALPENRGFGAAMNAGIQAAARSGCACFLMLNPDASVEPAVVAALHEHSLADPLALVTPSIVSSHGETVFAGSRVLMDSGRIQGLRPVSDTDRGTRSVVRSSAETPVGDWLAATCLVIHRDLFERVGGFDESYFLYWEDVDLSHRCEQAGGRLVVRADLSAVHDEGGTQGDRRGRAKSNTYYYYNCRNRLLFATRHLSRRQTVRWIWHTPAESWQILMRGGRRQLLHSPGTSIAACHGSLDGLVLAVRAACRPTTRSRRRTLMQSGSPP